MEGLVRLASGVLRLDLVPQAGGAIARFATEGPGGGRDWMRPMSAGAIAARDVAAAACFPLVPFSNRIRDRAFAFDGRAVHMAHPFHDAEHGHGWLSPWQVERAGADHATLTFARPATKDWPFAYAARQAFALTAAQLEIGIEIVNTGTTRMPAGLGLHPYFPRTPMAILRAQVDGLWETDARILPTRLVAPEQPRDPRAGLAVDRVALDNCFAGWAGRAEIAWPETGDGLEMIAEGPVRFLVVYTPPGEDFFCAEPVSNATDAFNLAAAGRTDTGMLVLEPGRSASARVTFTPR
ncbi:MAG: aldose 1-epimerase [Rhodospirillales bacterium]